MSEDKEAIANSSQESTQEILKKILKKMAQSLFLCDASFLTYSLLLASMILRKKYSSSG